MITIVLLPGMDGTGTLYEPLRKALEGKCKLIVVTYPVDQKLDYAALEKVARTYLPTDDKYILLGESFSGPVAISIAASRPERLRALILCASFARNPRPGLAWLRHLLPFLPVNLMPVGLLSHLLLGKFSNTELHQLLVGAMAKVSPEVLKGRMNSVLQVDVRQRLSDINAPVLYLRAIQDRVVPFSAYKDIAEHLASMTLHEFDAPHFLLQTKSEELAGIISASCTH